MNYYGAEDSLIFLSGFISIHCEVPSASNNETSEMNYISDATFIETGTSTLSMKFYDIRSIPEGMKNCYTSSPGQAKESKYLIRASFIHGNHDSQSNPPEFGLYNSWDSIKLEIIHMPPSNDVFVCPANTGLGTHGKIEERIAFFKVVQSEKQSIYHGYVKGLTPAELMERLKNGSLSLSLGENPSLRPSVSSQQKDKKLIIPMFLLSIAMTIFLTLKRRKKQGFVEKRNDSVLELNNRNFTYSEVLRITDNFKSVLSKDRFGTVYHGYLDDTQVAVKMVSSFSGQGCVDFQAQVKLLMRVHHRNLTNLIGYCNEDNNMGLVFEYMANGNLQQHLSGLECLHQGCKPSIVHGDIKSVNILLNEKFEAKLTDFGLSRTLPLEDGTPGYLDPEYYVTNRLDEKTDLYSFGVVLLEIITNRPVILKTENENTHLSQWVIDRVETGDMENIADPSLQGDFGSSSAWKVVELALACAYHVSSKRPTIDEVVMELKECLAMELAWKKDPSQPSWQ
ncbi:hypothetical protein LWI29_035548 [Acer saccharum]|uniref:Protein kinase domain-containing protein n=1 Tax=Acer saccharum TaxID=4024 RepID=A0AA39SSS7_ACESA|nr:hypothetical protein LWI29_035548 [Acer saccharum]